MLILLWSRILCCFLSTVITFCFLITALNYAQNWGKPILKIQRGKFVSRRWQRTINIAHLIHLIVVYGFEVLSVRTTWLPVERYLLLGFYLYTNTFKNKSRLSNKIIGWIFNNITLYTNSIVLALIFYDKSQWFSKVMIKT